MLKLSIKLLWIDIKYFLLGIYEGVRRAIKEYKAYRKGYLCKRDVGAIIYRIEDWLLDAIEDLKEFDEKTYIENKKEIDELLKLIEEYKNKYLGKSIEVLTCEEMSEEASYEEVEENIKKREREVEDLEETILTKFMYLKDNIKEII